MTREEEIQTLKVAWRLDPYALCPWPLDEKDHCRKYLKKGYYLWCGRRTGHEGPHMTWSGDRDCTKPDDIKFY